MTDPEDPTEGAPERTAPQTEATDTSSAQQSTDARAQLEEQVAAMRARDARAAADAARKPLAGAVTRVTEMLRARGINPDDELRARLTDEYGDQPGDDLRAYQAQVRARAWQNDLRAADHTGLAHWTLDKLEPDQHPDVLRRYIDALVMGEPQILNLILTGRIGPGKTSAAIAAGNTAAAAGLTVRFVKHSTYLAWLRPDGAPDGLTVAQIRTRYRRCQLLILDDLGSDLHLGEASEFVQRETNELVGDRLTGERGTIYTTNLTREDLTIMLGARALSRIGGRAHPVKFDGPDRRKPVTW